MRSGVLLAFCLALAAQATESGRPRITGISHVAYAVSSLDHARAFYRDVLGLSEEPGGVFRINPRQFVKVLVERNPGGDRLRHIAFRTDNPAAMRDWMKGHGLGETDPDGHRIEFVADEPAPFSAASSRISGELMQPAYWWAAWETLCATGATCWASPRRGAAAATVRRSTG